MTIRIWSFLLLAVACAAGQANSRDKNQECASCHQEEAKKVAAQTHASVGCQTCHRQHEEFPHPIGVPKPACADCHSSAVEDYVRGAHGQAAGKGDTSAPDCAVCHGAAHEIPSTKTAGFRESVPVLCGACHSEIAEQYGDSVHGQAVKRGFLQAPVCTDCHGGHSTLPPGSAASPVHASHISDTCGSCHGNVRLTSRYGLPGDRIISFDASFHGLAAKSGSETVANCASCHGVHNIRRSSDPLSSVHPNNLAATCGKCHVGAGRRFALGRIHVISGQSEPVSARWVRTLYLWIIPLTIGFMFVHNFGDWLRKLRRLRFVPGPVERRAHREDAPTEGWSKEDPSVRMLPFERVEHALLAVSFVALAWTGFALKYPDHWWARPLLLWEAARSTRGLIHRIASLIFISGALAHVGSLIFSPRLRSHWRSLWFTVGDLREASANLAYTIGIRKRFPGRSPHSYVEKTEYWALIWGSMIMACSGVVLWANSLVLKWLPRAVLDVATAVHFYEAVLATLAVVVWHLYFVIFDPDVYPMDMAWLTGKSPRPQPHSPAEAKQEGEGAP